MKFLSVLGYMQDFLDTLYDEAVRTGDLSREDDLVLLRESALHEQFDLAYGEAKTAMTPALYAGFLQLYKTPEKAIGKSHEQIKLQKKRHDKGGKKGLTKWYNPLTWFNGKKEKRYNNLTNRTDLAEQYAQAHRYLLNKDDFSEQDLKFITNLRSMENTGQNNMPGRLHQGMYEKGMRMSNIYLVTHLEKIFGGMRRAFLDDVNSNKLPVPDGKHKNINLYGKWVSKYMFDNMNKNPQVMIDIINIWHETDPTLSGDRLFIAMMEDVIGVYLRNVFSEKPGYPAAIRNMAVEKGVDRLIGGMYAADDFVFAFRDLVIKTVDSEDQVKA